MHGNLDASLHLNRDSGSAPPALWLATPAAQTYFDPTLLTETDRARFLASRNPRRLEEFKVSRALQAVASSGRTVHSLSHSGGFAALLTAPRGSGDASEAALPFDQSLLAVGVDLEISRPRDVLRIARFAFSKEEVVALEQQTDSARDDLFYTLWTMKEALAKALRLNLIDALRQCVFTGAPEAVAAASIWPSASIWSGSAPTPSPWAIQVFQPRAGFFLAAACVGAGHPQALRTWEWPPQQAARWPVIAAAVAAAPAGVAVLPG